MLDFNHVCFAYPAAPQSITDLTFHINKGEFVAMIGTNGAGKSTISRLANGLLRPSSGVVSVDGLDTSKTKTSELARKVGFLFQNPDRQICQNTVEEEIAFGPKTLGFSEEKTKEIVDTMMEIFSLKGEWFPFERSRGERQRIALASVLATEPEFLILDEPTTGLDYCECIGIMDYLTKLNKEKNITVLAVSHDMELVQEYAKRVLVLTGGKLVGDGATNDIMKDLSILSQANVVPAQIPQLALRLGNGYESVYTVDDMLGKIVSLKEGK